MAIESIKKLESKPVKRKDKLISPPCKIVIRKLPPTFTEEEFKEAIDPVPEHNYFSFVPADKSLGLHAYSKAYINFLNPEEIFNFKEIFDGYVFVDQKGNEYPAIVEYAPFQKIPKASAIQKKDLRCGTIDEDSDYLQFLNNLSNPEVVTLPQIETMLEEIENIEKEQRANNGILKIKTPLLEYMEQRNGERLRPGERKRRKELERKQARDEAKRKRKEIIREWRYQKREEKREERKKRDDERQKWRDKRDKEDKERRAKERERKEKRVKEDKEKKQKVENESDIKKSYKQISEEKDYQNEVKEDIKMEEDVNDKKENIEIKELNENLTNLNLESSEENVCLIKCEIEPNDDKLRVGEKQCEVQNVETLEDMIKNEGTSHKTERNKSESRDDDTAEDTPSDSQNSQKDDKPNKDPRTERRIKNKDRPAMQLYRPGQSRLQPNQSKSNEGVGDGSNEDTSSSSSSPVMAFSEEKKEVKVKEENKDKLQKEKTAIKLKVKEDSKEEPVKEKLTSKPKDSHKPVYSQNYLEKKPRFRDSHKSGHYYEGEKESYGKYKEDNGKYKESYGTYKEDYDGKSSKIAGGRKGYSYHHERENKVKLSTVPGRSKEQESESQSVKISLSRRSTSQE